MIVFDDCVDHRLLGRSAQAMLARWPLPDMSAGRPFFNANRAACHTFCFSVKISISPRGLSGHTARQMSPYQAQLKSTWILKGLVTTVLLPQQHSVLTRVKFT